ncbi:PaaI family thioesterase (plasmid) [Legionella lytica]|uniref:PaaI family thioesterase n=1 Tax=Legionella lytica TaxID=96232 RepID=A0ABY4YDX8_9GAMM|nr:PaaI family thioesterase [Legionella lytica]USQ15299.1 PaaI family thioesterase [Legionella lytica]
MSIHEQVMQKMQEMATFFSAKNISLDLPPQSNLTLGTTYTEIEFGNMISATIPFNTKFMNPIHVFQGGFLSAAFDEVFGPLSYMAAARPVVTLELNTTFIRPFVAKDEFIHLRADLVAQSKSSIVMRAEAKTKAGKLVATATSNSLVLTDEHLQQMRN